MTRETEGEAERERRRYQRGLFDKVARLYQATRPGYPAELAEFAVATAGLGPGAPVLEVGRPPEDVIGVARVRKLALGG